MRRCVAVHMGAVLWSAVLHAALHSTHPLQPLQMWCCAHVLGVADMAEATQATTLILLATRIAQT